MASILKALQPMGKQVKGLLRRIACCISIAHYGISNEFKLYAMEL
jgi:hypothetical protein